MLLHQGFTELMNGHPLEEKVTGDAAFVRIVPPLSAWSTILTTFEERTIFQTSEWL
jgi:hypothetical protein